MDTELRIVGVPEDSSIMTERVKTDFIAVHCSATPPHMDVGEEEIRGWHTDKGWSDIGYNIVIRRDGRVEIGRPLDYSGAHVKGYNSRSLGVCLIGGTDIDGNSENNFTEAQFEALKLTLQWLLLVYPQADIQGHRDFPGVGKDCPCFDVKEKVVEWGL